MKTQTLMAGWALGCALVVTAIPALGATRCAPADPIAYWPMDGSGDEAVHGFAGALHGNVTFVAGVAGEAASFDGFGSYVDAGAHPEISSAGGSELSFSAWLLPLPDPQLGNPIPGNDEHGVVMTARTWCNEGNWQLYDTLSGTLYISKWYQGDESFLHSSVPLVYGVWSHVVVTYDHGVARFYVDGELQQEVTDDLVEPINTYVQNVQLGWDSCSSFYTGAMDEVAVYDRALSVDEIRREHERGLHGVPLCPALVPHAGG
jgi:hypothetical protein